MAWFEKEQRLKNLSPQHKEVWINSYGGKLGIESGAFEKLVTDYLDKQEKIDLDLNELSTEQKAVYDELENLKTALKAELKTFTAEIKNLPSNTLAEALANEATEEKKLIIEKLKLLNQQTREFTKSLPDTKQAGAEDTSHQAASTPGAKTDRNTRAGTGTGTGSDDVTIDKDATSKTTDFKPMTHAEAAALGDMLDATKKSLEDNSTPELDELEKQLTGAITDMHRSAQIERDRIPLLAVLTANKRKLSLFTSTVENLSEHGISALWSKQKASPPSVLVTGDDQVGVDKLRAAMRKLDLSGQDKEALDEANINLKQAETRLKKAEEDNNQDNIDKYKEEIKQYNKKISELNQKTTLKTQEVAAELQVNAGFLGLVGYKPGLTSLSGRHITVGAADQGLTFQMNFPTPLFSPGYYLSREHNTKADLVSMAELIKATGAQNIYFNIECRNPKMKQRLMQEAYEAALEVGGFKSITINGQEITKENMHEKLYKHTDPNTREETNKHQRKEQRAQELQGIAEKRRSEVKQAQAPEIENQQNVFKHAMHAERTALEKAAEKVASNAPANPSSGLAL
ncbi:MAG: hypothetical protein GW760_00975 [Legionella sp.]|nr:hypothetical protein [Legionella sp.]